MYIDKDVRNEKGSLPIFMVLYFFDGNTPSFLPGLKISSSPNLYGLISSMLEDIIAIASCMERVAENYPPYNVNLYA